MVDSCPVLSLTLKVKLVAEKLPPGRYRKRFRCRLGVVMATLTSMSTVIAVYVLQGVNVGRFLQFKLFVFRSCTCSVPTAGSVSIMMDLYVLPSGSLYVKFR